MSLDAGSRQEAATAAPPNADAAVTLLDCVALLEARRQRVCDAINDCARPTAACDADFNALLAERAAIGIALAQLRPLGRGEAVIAHPRDDH
jgi:hypothetical protein